MQALLRRSAFLCLVHVYGRTYSSSIHAVPSCPSGRLVYVQQHIRNELRCRTLGGRVVKNNIQNGELQPGSDTVELNYETFRVCTSIVVEHLGEVR